MLYDTVDLKNYDYQEKLGSILYIILFIAKLTGFEQIVKCG